jgi:hypothetical protein
LDKQYTQAKQVTDKIGSDFGSMASAMIVQGQSFTQAFTAMFQKMEEQIIEMIVKMITEWLVFEALSGMGGPMGAIGAKGLAGMGMGQATGGTMFADSPTLALFGEGGPETATFTPIGASTSGGGGGNSSQVNNVTVNVQGGMIDQDTLSKIGQYIVGQIRGQGQISFTRA